MRMYIRIINLILVLFSLSFAQYGKIRWNDLAPQVKDSIRHYVTIDEDFARSIAEQVYDVYYVDSTVTSAEMQTMFDQFDNSNIKLIFHHGTYNLSPTTYPILARNVRNLVIEGNGALIQFSGGTPGNYYMGFFGWECKAGGTGYRTASDFQSSWFTTNLYKDSVSIGVNDPSDFSSFNLFKGDMIVLTDSTKLDQVTPTSAINTGDMLFFDHWDTLAGPTYKMVFERPASFTVLCKDSLKWSQVVKISERSLTVSNLKIKNGCIYTNGLERFDISNCEFYTDQDTTSTLTASFAIGTCFTRNVLINNIYTRNYIRLGMGYGFDLIDFETAVLNNISVYNSIHGITTATSNNGGLNKMIFVNNYTYLSNYKNDFNKAVNTHGGLLNESYTNCYIEGASEGMDLRAVRSTLKNIIIKDAGEAIHICQSGYKDTYRKEFVDIDGLWVYRSNQTIYLEDAHAKTIKLNNINVFPSNDYAGTLASRLLSFHICDPLLPKHYGADSIFISNSNYTFGGTPLSMYNILNTYAYVSPDSFFVDYIRFDNCDLRGANTVIYQNREGVRDLIFNNCRIHNFTYLISGALDTTTTTKSFGKLEFTNCYIKPNNPSYQWSANNYIRYKSVLFKGCELSSTSPGILRNVYADTVSFIDNTFYRNTGRSTFSTNGNLNKVKTLKIVGNRISGNKQSTDIFDIDADVTNTFIVDNYLDCNVKRLMQLANTNVQIINNTFMPDSGVGSPTGAKVYTIGGVKGSIIGNTFLYDKDDGNYFYGFKFNASGDSLYIVNNTFILGSKAKKSSAQRLFDVEANAEIRIGSNNIDGWYQTLFTGTGTIGKAPFMWNRFRIDSLSTTNRTDTLSLYMGASEYVMPKK